MMGQDGLFAAVRILFFFMAIVVVWHLFAPSDWHVLSETSRKLWAMAGLGLYVIIIVERKRRREEDGDDGGHHDG